VVEGRHEVRILDAAAEELTPEATAAEILRWRPELVGITTIAATFRRAVALCEVLKAASPPIVTVLGGPHPTACARESLAPKAVDVVVVGEGEATFSELAATLSRTEDLGAVLGLGFKRHGAPVFTGPRPRAVLDALPFPARHLLVMDRYLPSAMHYRKLPAHSVVCGRGCPFRCTFCSCAKVFAGKVTIRSPENVAAEVRILKERWGTRELLFWDDTFGLSAGAGTSPTVSSRGIRGCSTRSRRGSSFKTCAMPSAGPTRRAWRPGARSCLDCRATTSPP
jgi:radical SAM superfamily enzyme YgiQ (UPF0313 family)